MAGVTPAGTEKSQAGRATVPIVALDFPDASKALDLVKLLGDECRFYKVGSELFTAAGRPLIEKLREKGCEVFLDLKLHDIPNTVAAAMRVIRSMDVRLATVHASGGRAMIRAAVDAAGSSCSVFAVTVLTSLDDVALAEITGKVGSAPMDTVLRLADLAKSNGASGVVCSGSEASAVRARFGPTLEMIVPGIRLPGDSSGDQSRVVTPEAAAQAGADYIVIGRSITASGDPVAAMRSVHRGLSGGLSRGPS